MDSTFEFIAGITLTEKVKDNDDLMDMVERQLKTFMSHFKYEPKMGENNGPG